MAEYVHPALPPKVQLEKWEQIYFSDEENFDVLLIEAYQAGADHELEACCEWLRKQGYLNVATGLQKDRRPKPLSLKKKAILAIETAIVDGRLSTLAGDVVRDALDLIKEE